MKARVLFIGGSDSSAGAGIQADLKTAMALGGFGMTVITAVTAQNTEGVRGIHSIPTDMVRSQLDAVIGDIGCDVVKTGMLGGASTVRAVAEYVEKAKLRLVVDPVLKSTSGTALFDSEGADALLTHLIPLATVVTPNMAEAYALSGKSEEDQAAEQLREKGADAVLITGGDGDGDTVTDVLFIGDRTERFSGPRVVTRHSHGTGCTLASAIATRLGQGFPIEKAVQEARHYVREALRNAPGLGAGHGPLEHNLGTAPSFGD